MSCRYSFVLLAFVWLSSASVLMPAYAEDRVAEDRHLNRAMQNALKYLARNQRADGSFYAKDRTYALANTAVCGLAMLAEGSKPGEGTFGRDLENAVSFVVSQVGPDGYIATNPKQSVMYTHAYALRFLAETQVVSPNDKTAAAIDKAVKLLVNCQNDEGGWRYTPQPRDADSCVTGCVLIALSRAKAAGADVPAETTNRAVDYLIKCQLGDGGFSYMSRPTGSAGGRSAAALCALCMSGFDGDNIKNGFRYFDRHIPLMKPGEGYFYYTHFHLASAMDSASDKQRSAWRRKMWDQLKPLQSPDGSWQKKFGDPTYVTGSVCYALLSQKESGNKKQR